MQKANVLYPKVGDVCWMKVSEDDIDMWECNWRVVEAGIPNEHGYPLNVLVAKDGWKNRRQVVAPFDESKVLFLPPEEEIPAILTAFIERKKLAHIRVVRNISNTDTPHYRLLCSDCKETLYIKIESTERAEFGFCGDTFYEGKPEYDECGSVLLCGCNDEEYDIPDEIEQYS